MYIYIYIYISGLHIDECLFHLYTEQLVTILKINSVPFQWIGTDILFDNFKFHNQMEDHDAFFNRNYTEDWDDVNGFGELDHQ